MPEMFVVHSELAGMGTAAKNAGTQTQEEAELERTAAFSLADYDYTGYDGAQLAGNQQAMYVRASAAADQATRHGVAVDTSNGMYENLKQSAAQVLRSSGLA